MVKYKELLYTRNGMQEFFYFIGKTVVGVLVN